jgi:hypothetical protein
MAIDQTSAQWSHPLRKSIVGKGATQLSRELSKLKLLIAANPIFDYAERAEIARTARAILQGAAAINRGHPRDAAAQALHNSVVEVFRTAIARAYPPAFWDEYQHLKEGNPSSLLTAVKFLEADPWFDGSGYTKAELIRRITRIELPHACAERLRQVVLAAVDYHNRREFRQYCRLARKVDSPELREELSLRLEHDDPAVRRRARWVLDGCEKAG